jgi:hypothetical protein
MRDEGQALVLRLSSFAIRPASSRHRQRELECRPPARLALRPHAPAVRLHQLLDDGQPQRPVEMCQRQADLSACL